MYEFIASIIIAGVCMAVLDGLWLSFFAKQFYKQQLGSLLLAKPNLLAALLFYAIYLCALVVFVIHPAVNNESLIQAVGGGALFGLATYATYDLTNRATLKNFSTKLVLVDLSWGVILTIIVSSVTYGAVTSWVS